MSKTLIEQTQAAAYDYAEKLCGDYAKWNTDFHRAKVDYLYSAFNAPTIVMLETALKKAQRVICDYNCMHHEELPTSHTWDCDQAREALTEHEAARKGSGL